MLEKAKRYAQSFLNADASGHDFFHTLRVLRVAARIAQEEAKHQPVDLEAVALMAILHDVDDRKISPDTYRNLDRARKFLREQGIAEDKQRLILNGISDISFRGTGSVIPETIEGKIVQDADRLDAMGAIGIARAFAYGGSRGRSMYDPEQPPIMDMDAEAYAKTQGPTINHFYEKLLLLKDMMNTETGKAMAVSRHGYMEQFLEEFYGEWEGTI